MFLSLLYGVHLPRTPFSYVYIYLNKYTQYEVFSYGSMTGSTIVGIVLLRLVDSRERGSLRKLCDVDHNKLKDVRR